PGGRLVRRDLAVRTGLRSAFSFPIIASEAGPILGVMTFLSRESLERDEPLLQAMTTLGRQIGLFAERRRTEAELMQVNARLNALLDASTQVSIIAADRDGLITVFNPGAERMLGYSAQEMVGVSTPLLIHDAQEVSAHAARLSAEFGTTIEGFDTFVRARPDSAAWSKPTSWVSSSETSKATSPTPTTRFWRWSAIPASRWTPADFPGMRSSRRAPSSSCSAAAPS